MTPKHEYALSYTARDHEDLLARIDDDNPKVLYVLEVDGEAAFAVGISRDGYLQILALTRSGWELLLT